jgi:hypothetical protein
MLSDVQQSVPLFRALNMVWCLFLLQHSNVMVVPSPEVKLDPYPGSKISVEVSYPVATTDRLSVVTAEAFDNSTLLILSTEYNGPGLDVLEIRRLPSGNFLFQVQGRNALLKPGDIFQVSTLAGAATSSVESYDTVIKLFASFTEGI